MLRSRKKQVEQMFLASAYYSLTGLDLPKPGIREPKDQHSIACQNILVALKQVASRLGISSLETLKHAFDGLDEDGNTLRKD